MMNGQLYFLIGLPRSGKSTIATMWSRYDIDIDNNEIKDRISSLNTLLENPRVVINADSIRVALSGDRFNYLTEEYVSGIKHTMIRVFLDMGYDVLVDGTHTTKSSIAKLMQIDISARYYIINTTKDECMVRAIETNQSDLIPIIERMNQQLLKLNAYEIEVIRANIEPGKIVL